MCYSGDVYSGKEAHPHVPWHRCYSLNHSLTHSDMTYRRLLLTDAGVDLISSLLHRLLNKVRVC